MGGGEPARSPLFFSLTACSRDRGIIRAMSISIRVVALAVLLVVLAGCRGTTIARDAMPPPLREIHNTFARVMADAYADPELDWKAGWTGNVAINLFGDRRRGLCWQWQELVYAGVKPTADRVGWACEGVQMNIDTVSEHHSVMVYDPQVVAPADALKDEPTPRQRVYVLDGWRYGEPDVFTLAEWLRLSSRSGAFPVREDLTHLISR